MSKTTAIFQIVAWNERRHDEYHGADSQNKTRDVIRFDIQVSEEVLHKFKKKLEEKKLKFYVKIKNLKE